MFIVTERTPNPDAMKFMPHVRMTDGAGWSFSRTDFDPGQSRLAARLFALADVTAVYIAADFVTVTRSSEGEPWAALRLQAISAIADHLESGEAAVAADLAAPGSGVATNEDIVEEIQSVLGLWIRPGVARDGGDILFDRFDRETGALWIRMHGACGGCPSSKLTLKGSVERIVRRYVPEVLSVEEVPIEAGSGAPARPRDWAAVLPDAAGPKRRPVFTHAGRPLPLRSAGDGKDSRA